MTLKKKGKYWYGTTREDLMEEVRRYSKRNAYVATRFADPHCSCGSTVFKLESDEEAGAVKRICSACDKEHLMGDSKDYADDATFENHICVCDSGDFELAPGVALYSGSNDVKWFYVGCRCVKCGLVGVFVDYKCEAGDSDAFLIEA